MARKSTFVNLLLATTLSLGATSVWASDAKFKVAVIKDSVGSQDIMQGDYNKGIKKLVRQIPSQYAYNKHMALCVAYLQIDNASASEASCTQAINDADALSAITTKSTYLKSLSYNNRAVARYKNDDLSGAYKDLLAATSLDKNVITKSNLQKLALMLSNKHVEEVALLSE